MIDNGFSSPRSDAFPAGLRVLVVDDDPTWLKILEKMLKRCNYEVTTCGLARDALKLLRERKDGYDIVISDVNMPDMDGFKLLEDVGLEMDLPVIMMSVDGETSRVMKGVQHGACDYLLKPIRMKELRNIWQHVLRKKIHEARDIELLEGMESIQMTRFGSDYLDGGQLFYTEDVTSVKKRKDVESKHDDKDGDNSSTKKARVVWSVELHQKFVKAVNQIGFDKVGPKKILDLMNVPWLTRENVASHLQKYRLYLSRLQKENDSKTSVGAIKHSDSSIGDSAGSFVTQNSVNTQQKDVTDGNYGFSRNSVFVQNSEPRSRESEKKGPVLKNAAESRRVLDVDFEPLKPKSSQMEFGCSFSSTASEVNFAALDSSFPAQGSWCEIPQMQIKQETQPLHLDNGFNQLPVPGPEQIKADYRLPPPPIISSSSTIERELGNSVKIKSSYDEGSSNASHVSSIGSVSDSSYVLTIPDNQAFEPICTSTSSIKNQELNLNCISGISSAQKSVNWEESSLATLDDDFQICWLPGDCYGMNVAWQNIDFPENYDTGLFAGVPTHLYDAVRFDYDSSFYDTTEYSLIEQGLFIT